MPIKGNKYLTLRQPSVKAKSRPPRLLVRQRPIVGQISERQTPTMPLTFEMQRPAAPQLLQKWKVIVLPIFKRQSCCADQVHSIHQLHASSMQHLEMEALEKEGRDHLSCLPTCGVALQDCLPDACRLLMYPSNYSWGTCPWATSWLFPLVHLPPDRNLLLWIPARPPWWQPHPAQVGNNTIHLTRQHSQHDQEMQGCLKSCPAWNKKVRHPSEVPEGRLALVWQTREDYFQVNCPHFDCETLQDLCSLFRDMIISANLLNSDIFKIQKVWTEQEDLQYANDAWKSLPKGLWFFHLVSPLELDMVMGLEGIQHPDSLGGIAGVTFCPWCGKEGQNEGTIVNHLWTTHYNLGLVCEKWDTLLLCHHLRDHSAPWPRLQTAQGTWQGGRTQGSQWYIPIRLVNPFRILFS